jgi:hypothetical protein
MNREFGRPPLPHAEEAEDGKYNDDGADQPNDAVHRVILSFQLCGVGATTLDG